jgi:hypothetical protein
VTNEQDWNEAELEQDRTGTGKTGFSEQYVA